MVPIKTPLPLGDLKAMLYLYEKAGDELAVHRHDEAANHITIVSSGSFRCIGNPDIEGKIITIGMVIDWPVGEPHGFVALEDGAKMVQIGKSYYQPH